MLIFSGVSWLVSKSWQESNTKVAAKVGIWSKNPSESLQNIPLISVGFGWGPSQTRHMLQYITVISIQESKTGFWGKTSSWRRKWGSGSLGFTPSNNLCPVSAFLGNPAHSVGRRILKTISFSSKASHRPVPDPFSAIRPQWNTATQTKYAWLCLLVSTALSLEVKTAAEPHRGHLMPVSSQFPK